MKLGLVLLPYPPVPASALASALSATAVRAETAGFDSIWVVDHLLTPPEVGPIDSPMLDAYTTLGYLAGMTTHVTLGTLVSGVTQRHPAALAKAVTTLDVLSNGRAWLGVGAAWFAREHEALGVPFPALRERFERLEETVQIVRQLWSDQTGPYSGHYYRLHETIGAPSPLSSSGPPILIGGSGPVRTMDLVARYADACNLFPDTLAAGLSALRRCCDQVQRDYSAIEKTVYYRMDLGKDRQRVAETCDELLSLSNAGAETAICEVKAFSDPDTLDAVGEEVLPVVRSFS